VAATISALIGSLVALIGSLVVALIGPGWRSSKEAAPKH